MIVGPGSISFEMIRFLTECFPVLPGPGWLKNKVQPVSARNVIDYLVAALDHPEARGGIYELGGPEVMLYADTMLRYARLRGLKRWLFTLPGIPDPDHGPLRGLADSRACFDRCAVDRRAAIRLDRPGRFRPPSLSGDRTDPL